MKSLPVRILWKETPDQEQVRSQHLGLAKMVKPNRQRGSSTNLHCIMDYINLTYARRYLRMVTFENFVITYCKKNIYIFHLPPNTWKRTENKNLDVWVYDELIYLRRIFFVSDRKLVRFGERLWQLKLFNLRTSVTWSKEDWKHWNFIQQNYWLPFDIKKYAHCERKRKVNEQINWRLLLMWNKKSVQQSLKGHMSRLKQRVFMIMTRSLHWANFIILKLEETITKRNGSKEIWTKQTK